nr:NUDIX domain-containing protein [Paenibacillus borealis]
MILEIIVKNNWERPGGKGEDNESAEETARREVFEEVGLEVRIHELIGVYYEAAHDMHHFVFIADNADALNH